MTVVLVAYKTLLPPNSATLPIVLNCWRGFLVVLTGMSPRYNDNKIFFNYYEMQKATSRWKNLGAAAAHLDRGYKDAGPSIHKVNPAPRLGWITKKYCHVLESNMITLLCEFPFVKLWRHSQLNPIYIT